METVREAKFGRDSATTGRRRVAGGDVVVVVDGWANFSEAMPKHVDTDDGLLRARNYGVRVVLTHTSQISGLRFGAEKRVPPDAWRLSLTDWRSRRCPASSGLQGARGARHPRPWA